MADRERTYLIRVSAALERSTASVAGDMVQQFDRAQRTIERNQRASGDRAQKHVAGIRDRYFAEQQRAEDKAAAQKVRVEERAAAQKVRTEERAQQHVARIKERYFRDQQREQERKDAEEERAVARKAARVARIEQSEAKKALEERKSRVRQIASDSYQNIAAAGSKALQVGGQLAGGMGVNFDVQSGVQKAVQLQKLAMAVATSGNRGDLTQADLQKQAKGYETQAREVGNKYAFDPSKVLTGLASFQAKTGDLTTASAGLDRYAKLAKAFNVELDDMISAAGEISSKLEDSWTPGEKRAQKTYEILKMLTSQGQEGSIEIAQLATEMARIGGGAGFFGGDVGKTIEKLGALAQLARATGGATSAADSARSVAAFVTTFKTPARRKAFETAGVKLEDDKGFFRDPIQIIKDSLLATGGNAEKMNELFKSSLASKSIDSLVKTFKGAGGGDAGLAAIDKMVGRFTRPIEEHTITANGGAYMSTTESKAQLFQNKPDQITASLAERVLPAMERMAPHAESVAKAFASIVTAVADNPGKAITLAIVGSIAKATIGPAISKAIVDNIAGKLTGGGGVAGSGIVGAGLDPARKVAGMAAGTAGSLLGSATMIGAIAVTTFTVGSMVVDKMIDAESEANKKRLEGELGGMNMDAIFRGAAKTGTMSEEDRAAVTEQIRVLSTRIQMAENEKGQLIPGMVGAILRAGENAIVGGPGYETMRTGQQDIADLPELKQRLAAYQANLENFGNKTLTIKGVVEVSNMASVISGGGGQSGVPDAPNASY